VIKHHEKTFKVLEKFAAEIALIFNYTLETANKMQSNLKKLSQGYEKNRYFPKVRVTFIR